MFDSDKCFRHRDTCVRLRQVFQTQRHVCSTQTSVSDTETYVFDSDKCFRHRDICIRQVLQTIEDRRETCSNGHLLRAAKVNATPFTMRLYTAEQGKARANTCGVPVVSSCEIRFANRSNIGFGGICASAKQRRAEPPLVCLPERYARD